ncbi:MAG: hypothetical protein ACE5FS_03455 [Paracoccaceae bacterium]
MTTYSHDELRAFITKKAEIDAMLTRLQAWSADHFNRHPDEITWADAGDLSYYAEQLRQITNTAFHEGEHST